MLQVSQRPLSGSDADQRLFVNRDEETDAVLRALDLGFSVLVLGDPRSGRTSLLRHIERRAADAGRRTAFVDARTHADLSDLVEPLRTALAMNGGRQSPDARWAVTEQDIAAIASATEEPTTVFTDDLSPGATHTLFGRFRDALWEFPHQWVVSGLLVRRSDYLEAPADSFFDWIVELGPLDEDAARSLLRKRIEAAGDSEDARLLERSIERIVNTIGERTPGMLLAGVRAALLHRGLEGRGLEHLAELQSRAGTLGRTHALVFNELESLAPVHAGDERLLQRLGYTRPRIVQILKDLENVGVVASRREGRRQMYYLRPGSGQT